MSQRNSNNHNNENSSDAFNPFIPDVKPEPPLRKALRLTLGLFILLPIRIVLCALFFIFWLILLQILSIGVKPVQKEFYPVPIWRKKIFRVISYSVRAFLFSMGFYTFHRHGKLIRDPTKVPIIIANHVSAIDVFVVASLFPPCGISEAENLKLPFISTYLKVSQAIILDRKDPQSRRNASELINARAHQAFKDSRLPQLLIFPEGTTTNGKSLITFRNGAFTPGLPVQPIYISYQGNPYVDYSWTVVSSSLPKGFIRMLTEWKNSVSVTFLDPYVPNEAEKADPAKFARHVRLYMAEGSRLPITDASFDDARFLLEAKKLRMSFSNLRNVGFTSVSKHYNTTLDEAKVMLKQFVAGDRNRSGRLERDEFLKVLQLPLTPETQELFDDFCDERGSVDFRQYIIGISSLASNFGNIDDLIKHCFTLFDTDGDGTIKKSEFTAMMRCQFPEITDEQINAIFQEMDVNKDQKISYDLFSKYAKTQPMYVALAKKKLAQTTAGKAINSLRLSGKQKID